MINKMTLICILWGVINPFQSNAQGEMLNAAQLKEDLTIAYETIATLSPGIGAVQKASMQQKLKRLLPELNGKSMDVAQFLKFLLNTKIEAGTDEHGNFSLPGALVMEMFKEKDLFPVPVVIINRKLYTNSENSAIPYGAEIITINGHSADTILKKLSKGRIEDSFELKNIENSFDILYKLFFEQTSMFKVAFKEPGLNVEKEVEIKAIGIEERTNILSERIYPLKTYPSGRLINTQIYPDLETYYFQLNSFEMGEYVGNNKVHFQKFKKRLDTVFQRARESKAKHLIIDLRQNLGGDALIPALLYSYIAKKAFKETIHLNAYTFAFPYTEYIFRLANKKMDSLKLSNHINKLQKSFSKTKKGYELMISNKRKKPDKKAFKGKVYLIVGGNTVSAAAYFTALFKSEKRGTIFGDRVGGAHRNVTAGQMIEYRLPNSGIELEIPLMLLTFSKKITRCLPEERILPTRAINYERRYQQFLKKEDIELNETLDFIRAGFQ